MRAATLLFTFVICLSAVAALEGFSEPRNATLGTDSLLVYDTAVYSTGFYSNDAQSWEEFSFSGQERSNWVIGQATTERRTDANYYAFYTCTWSQGWDCSETWQVLDQAQENTSEERDEPAYVPKDSVQGDFEALQALYEHTQGQYLEVLASEEELPAYNKDLYPPLYMINGDVYAVRVDSRNNFKGWYNAGKPWKDSAGWEEMTPQTMGDAVGVEVNENGRVVVLDMQKIIMQGDNTLGNGLTGVLPQEIGNLQRLEYLNLKQNFFHGTIPQEIGQLQNLHQLSLAGQRCEAHAIRGWFEGNHRHCKDGSGKAFEETNAFTGPLPSELGSLEDLWMLEIRGQYLTGTLPPEWGSLKNLERLFLNGVKGPDDKRLYGEIPPEWAGMEKMQYFHLGNYREDGRLTGDIPPEINEGWTNLWNTLLAGNEFTGPVPEFLNSRNKRYGHFSSNNFSGGFPSGWLNGDNGGLNAIKLNHNPGLTGPLPTEIPSPDNKERYNLGTIRLIGTNFNGPIPHWLQNSPVIQFNLNGVDFSGPFPKDAAESDRLRLFWIANNRLSGTLPDVNWTSPALYSILINGNDFEGEIPDSWRSMVENYRDENGAYTGRLWRMYLSGNELEGEIPSWVADITTLNRFHIQNNRFTFKDILPYYDDILDTMEIAVLTGRNDNPDFRVSPQKPFGDADSIRVSAGDSFSIDFSSEVGYAGNAYEWLLDGDVVSSTTLPTYSVSSASPSDAGVYVLRVTNPALEELTLYSQEVEVVVS